MIYRLICESVRWYPDGDGWRCGTGALRGAMLAGLCTFGDLPAPGISNERARFWFTEAGWQEYGRPLLAEAYHCGRTWRLLQQKNPPPSAVIYRDRWQVAVLPVKRKQGP